MRTLAACTFWFFAGIFTTGVPAIGGEIDADFVAKTRGFAPTVCNTIFDKHNYANEFKLCVLETYRRFDEQRLLHPDINPAVQLQQAFTDASREIADNMDK